jgi:hypothetical protein
MCWMKRSSSSPAGAAKEDVGWEGILGLATQFQPVIKAQQDSSCL